MSNYHNDLTISDLRLRRRCCRQNDWRTTSIFDVSSFPCVVVVEKLAVSEIEDNRWTFCVNTEASLSFTCNIVKITTEEQLLLWRFIFSVCCRCRKGSISRALKKQMTVLCKCRESLSFTRVLVDRKATFKFWSYFLVMLSLLKRKLVSIFSSLWYFTFLPYKQ